MNPSPVSSSWVTSKIFHSWCHVLMHSHSLVHHNTSFLVKCCIDTHTQTSTLQYLVPCQELDRGNPLVILLAPFQLLEEVNLLLAGQNVDCFLTQHHHCVCQLIAKQPRLPTQPTMTSTRRFKERYMQCSAATTQWLAA